MQTPTDQPTTWPPMRTLIPFILITFGLAWGVLALFIFLPGPMTAAVGPLTGDHPLFFLAVYAPAIAALVVITAVSGPGGLRRYLGKAARWRCSWSWALFLLLGVPAVFYAGAAMKGSLVAPPVPLLALLLAAVKGPVEELGWRGFALPMLQRRLAPAWASLVLGLVWGVWHLPAFLLSGTQQSAWSFTPFLIGTVAISVVATALFNTTGGSVLLAAVLHFQLMNPLWPDAQPYDTWLLVAVAAVMLWRQRELMFRGRGAVTEVVPVSGRRPSPSATTPAPAATTA